MICPLVHLFERSTYAHSRISDLEKEINELRKDMRNLTVYEAID